MPLPDLDEFDQLLDDSVEDAQEDTDQTPDEEGDEPEADAEQSAADAEAEFERRYRERFNKDAAALRSTLDKQIGVLRESLDDLNVEIAAREEYITALEAKYEQYDGDDANALRRIRKERAAQLKDQAKLKRLEGQTQAVQLAADRQTWLADNVRNGAYPQEVLTDPDVQAAIAENRSNADVMQAINRTLTRLIRKPAASDKTQAKVAQTQAREQARGKQPLGKGGSAPPKKISTFEDAEAAIARGLRRLNIS